MRILKKDETNNYLRNIGMEVGGWNNITDLTTHVENNGSIISQKAPDESRSLYCFSQHVAKWLPRGDWKIFQIDNSSSFSLDEKVFISNVLCGAIDSAALSSGQSFLFEFINDWDADIRSELVIANIIYVFLMFGAHGYIVSSASKNGEILAIQDGYVNFQSRDPNSASAKEILNEFIKNPIISPQWVIQPERQ